MSIFVDSNYWTNLATKLYRELTSLSFQMLRRLTTADELHPPEDSGDCPMCLEIIKHVNSGRQVDSMAAAVGYDVNSPKSAMPNMKKKDLEGFGEMFSGKCPLCLERFCSEGKEAGAWFQTI